MESLLSVIRIGIRISRTEIRVQMANCGGLESVLMGRMSEVYSGVDAGTLLS